jgi:hypothetical protein
MQTTGAGQTSRGAGQDWQAIRARRLPAVSLAAFCLLAARRIALL